MTRRPATAHHRSSRIVALTDPRAQDPALVGAKAADLARAQAHGLPVLPGVAVAVAESGTLVQAALKAQTTAGGPSRGRIAALRVTTDPGLVEDAVERLASVPQPWVVRSSSPHEGEGTWSGAFSSFHGATSADLGIAIRGCWGSAFAPAVLERAERVGVEVSDLGMGVLIQQEIQPSLGGTARVQADGSVTVISTDGSMRALMDGHVEGTVDQIPKGSPRTDIPGRAAELAHQVLATLSRPMIEWGEEDGVLYLLQCSHSRTPEPIKARELDSLLADPLFSRLARLAQMFPGRLGNEHVLPWAIACPDEYFAATSPAPGTAAFLELSETLTAHAWGGRAAEAQGRASEVLRALRSNRRADALREIHDLQAPDAESAGQALASLAALRRSWLDRGLSEPEFWNLDDDTLLGAAKVAPPSTPLRWGPGVWEPLTFETVRVVGEHHPGVAAAPGAGSGAPRVQGDVAATPASGRYVIVADQPVPSLAPFLWDAAGLVTRAGTPAAHLIEFARSIGVPAVVGCRIPRDLGPDVLLAVDGDRGEVSILETPNTRQ